MTAITPVAMTPRSMLAALIMAATATTITTTAAAAPALENGTAHEPGVVTSVDIHPTEARVTRVVSVPAITDASERILVIGPLPRRVLPLSLGVEVDADSDVTVLDVSYRRREHDSAPALDAALASVARSLTTNAALRAEVERQAEVLDRMGRFGVDAAMQGALRGGPDTPRSVLDASGVAQFTQQLFADRDGLVHRTDELQRAAERLEQQRTALLARRTADETADVHEVVLRLAGGTTASALRLHYRVSSVRWEIVYEARARSGSGELGLTQFASISQASGEDWRDAELRLFTTPPHVAADASLVEPLQLALSRTASGANVTSANLSGGTAKAGAASEPALPPQLAELLYPSDDGVSWRGGRTHADAAQGPRFRATVTATVLNDAPRRVALGSHSLDAMVLHLAQPLRGPDVFRRAALTNTTGRSLPAGPLRVWMDGEVAGDSMLASVSSGAEFDVGLGVDPAITARRVVVSREESTRANRRIVTLRLALAVSSASLRDVSLEVADVIPNAPPRSGIKITELDATPAPRRTNGEDGEQDNGRRRWSASLAPGQQWQAEYGYRVEYDAAFELGVLATK